MEITQFIWQHREIPNDMVWKNLVLIPKGNTDTRGVGLLGSPWMVVEAIIDNHMGVSVHLHEVLHGFHAVRVTGAEILGLNMEQDFANVD